MIATIEHGQLPLFAEFAVLIGGIYVNDLPCPDMAMSVDDDNGCYNYMAKVEVLSVISGERAIVRNCKLLDISNHNGLTIVPIKYLS